MRVLALLIITAPLAAAADPQIPREPFAKAHVSMMARVQPKAGADAQILELDVWAEGTRLRAAVRGDPSAGVFWVDGLAPEAMHLVDGKPVPTRPHTASQALQISLGAARSHGNANTDRIAGHPCKLVNEQVDGLTMTRCIWRGLPLSIEMSGKGGFSFNAAATLVEEGAVTVADLQPPPGAPAAPASLSAGR